jgi:hypothetical protein
LAEDLDFTLSSTENPFVPEYLYPRTASPFRKTFWLSDYILRKVAEEVNIHWVVFYTEQEGINNRENI